MPGFEIDVMRKQNKEGSYPVAIIKGEQSSKFFNKFLYVSETEGVEKIQIPEDVNFQILPDTDPNKRNCIYLAGCSGSGKSFLAKQIAENYHKMFPARKIWIVSKLDSDETLDSTKAPLLRVKIDLIKDGIRLNDLANSLIIFDDYDTITGRDGKAVQELMEDIAIMGRKHHEGQGCISMLCLTHYLTNYKRTRLLLQECDTFIVYPQSTSSHALNYLLKTHLGLEKNEVKKLKKMGRWVMLRKTFPQFLVSAHEAQILHGED